MEIFFKVSDLFNRNKIWMNYISGMIFSSPIYAKNILWLYT